MSERARNILARVVQLRRAFDDAFSRPAVSPAEDIEHLLTIRIAGQLWALKLSEILGVHPLPLVVPLPRSRPGLLGLAGIRSSLVPVYRLASLIGGGPGTESARWLALIGSAQPVALAFDSIEGYLQVQRAALIAAPEGQVGQVTRYQGLLVPIVDLGAVAARLAA